MAERNTRSKTEQVIIKLVRLLADAQKTLVICYFAPTSGKPNLPTYIGVKWADRPGGQTDQHTLL